MVCNLLNQVDPQPIAIDVDSLLRVEDFGDFLGYVRRNQSQVNTKVHLSMDSITQRFINNVVGSLNRFDQYGLIYSRVSYTNKFYRMEVSRRS